MARRRRADAGGGGLAYDPDCYLCPGNTRANGNANPAYTETYVFPNDFAALRPDTSIETFDDGLLRAEGERGSCRVVCFSPRHDLTLGRMARDDVRRVIDVWAEQTAELGAAYRWVQVFENRGEAMGASNPHPHGQIWAGTALPGDGAREDASQRAHLAATGRRLLLDYVDQESGGPRVDRRDRRVAGRRAVLGGLAVRDAAHPEAARGPPDRAGRRRARRPGRRAARADRPLRRAVQAAVPVLDGLAPGAVRRRDDTDHWQVHAHFYPPLLRANVRKFMVGYELLAETQRDLTAEDAAGRLRAVVLAAAPAGESAAPEPTRA